MALDLPPLVITVGRLLLVLAVAYVCIIAMFAVLEGWLVYPAPKASRAELSGLAERVGAREVELKAADGTQLYGWRLPGRPEGEYKDLLFILFSGNGSSVSLEVERYQLLGNTGGEVLHVNYRGYPGSDGRPSEKGIIADARAVWAEATSTHSPGDIVIVAKSLGGGPAVALTRELSDAGTPPRALYLESVFASALGVATDAYPWLPARLVMRNRWRSDERARGIDCPTVVSHGDLDEVIEVHHGRRMAESVPGARYVEVRGAMHNDVLLAETGVWDAFAQLLRAATQPSG